ncbi:FxsB family cyclophane-forming radical SAM/SPASM peptide maturase [Actinacidiphila sp. bgisy167]|uniref:FxsB family cyclophane-forming radical SAM/SPASM peptide maturase n=1 Tax=Actinacidiphila sp. bgisy167 TaxID=3413797 RepID=UPI003D737E36
MTPSEDSAPAFRTFILKTVNRCNIDCDYCYVFNSADQSARRLPARMHTDVARAAAGRIAEHATFHQLKTVHIVIHGGEPLLAGVRHTARLLAAVRDGLPPDVEAHFELQTNATLLSDAWLDLFDAYGVAVGVSLDGPPAVNDRHRLTRAKRSTAASTVRGIDLLRTRPHLFAGILAVVDLAHDPVEVHDYLAGFQPPVIDFGLPHATHDHPPPRGHPGVPEYGIWLSRVHDAWIARPEHHHSVRILEDIAALSAGIHDSVETVGLAPPAGIVIESDGTIEGVDTLRSVHEGASHLGLDVFRHTLDQALHHPELDHRRLGRLALAHRCQTCPLVPVCGGGYLPHRFSTAHGYRNPSVYCADLEYLIQHVQQTLQRHGWTLNN